MNAVVAAAYDAGEIIVVGKVVLNTAKRLLLVNGTPVDLTSPEYQVLVQLMKAAGTIISRQALEHAIYGDRVVLSNVLQVYVGRLRKKLAAVDVESIQTVWGQGYRYELPKAGFDA